MAISSQSFVKGVPELLILRLLANREMYGYELIKAMRISTDGQLEFGEGVVYPTLHSLEQQGFLKSRTTLVRGRNRVHYQTTAKGKRRLEVVHGEWQRVTSAVSKVLEVDGGLLGA